MSRDLLVLLGVLSLTACGDRFLGVADNSRLPGERQSVMLLEPEMRPDERVANLDISLPPPQTNAEWPQAGGYPTHAMDHLTLPDDLQLAWRADIGTARSGNTRLIAPPVIGDGRVFSVDARGEIRAFDAQSGDELWRYRPDGIEEESTVLGGGLAFAEGWLFVALSSGDVLGLNSATGNEVWRQSLQLPLRSAPAVAGALVLILTADNQLYALNGTDGQPVWRHAGFPEAAAQLGGPNPATDERIALVPYSSGEVFALSVADGRPLWQDSLVRPRRTLAMGAISDINGHPVIDRDRAYVAGLGGEMAAFDLLRGNRLWQQELTTAHTPWIAGDYLYALTTRNEVVALLRQGGRVRWVTPLQRFRDPDNADSTPVSWAGPVLGGDRLLLVSSLGEAISLSPYTGEVLGRIDLPDGSTVPPVIANGTLYVLTVDGDLLAYR